MGRHRITINSSADWAKAADEIEQIAKQYERGLDEACKEIAEAGRNEAASRYVAHSSDGNNAVSTSVVRNGNADYNVSAEGSDLYFNEFGAGISTDTAHPYASGANVTIAPGSYSSSSEGTGQFARNGFWWWNRRRYEGIVPSRALYNARNYMESKVTEIVRRCFK